LEEKEDGGSIAQEAYNVKASRAGRIV